MHKHASNKEHVAVIENEIHKVEMDAQDEWSSPKRLTRPYGGESNFRIHSEGCLKNSFTGIGFKD